MSSESNEAIHHSVYCMTTITSQRSILPYFFYEIIMTVIFHYVVCICSKILTNVTRRYLNDT